MASTRIVSIVGRKNAGKTTLAVALASEYARRGHRIMTIKHGHHPADVDRGGYHHAQWLGLPPLQLTRGVERLQAA